MVAQASAGVPGSILRELKRRKVHHTAVSYAAIVFATWQVTDIVFPALGLPPSFMRFVVVAALMGFPVAIGLAWFFEVVPQSPATDQPVPRRRWARATLLACIVTVVLGTLGWSTVSRDALAMSPGEWVLVTDLRGPPEDSTFAAAMDEALRLALTQSSVVNIFPPNRVREGLARMRRPQNAWLDEATAVELAQREGVPAVLVPSLRRVGDELTFVCRIVDPRTGETLRSRSVRTSSESGALAAVDGLARELRQELGESLTSLVRGRVQLYRATTSSLDALMAWSEAMNLWDAVRYEEVGLLLKRAVALDSTFALAQASLGQWYYWAANEPLAGEAAFGAALRHLGGLPERERLLILGTAAEWRGDREGAISSYSAVVEMDPDDPIIWGKLGYQYLRLDRPAEAMAAYRRVLELDSLDASGWINLATVHNMKGEPAEAVPLYERAFRIQPNLRTETVVNEEFGQALISLGRYEDAAELFGAMLASTMADRARGLRSLALLDMLQGRYRSAIDRLRQSVLLHEAGGSTVSELRDRAFLASALLRGRGRSEAAAEARTAGALALGNYVATGWVVIPGVVAARAGETGLARELLDTAQARSNGSADDRAIVKYLEGAIALAVGDAGGAAERLAEAMVLGPGFSQVLALAAEANHQLGDLEGASRLWAELVARGVGGASKESQEGWVLAHYRLGTVYEQLGRTGDAVEALRTFLSLWGEGDPELVEVTDARRRLTGLTGPGGP